MQKYYNILSETTIELQIPNNSVTSKIIVIFAPDLNKLFDLKKCTT